jgi:hypothetical protein
LEKNLQAFERKEILEGVLLNGVEVVVGEAEHAEAGEALEVRVVHHRQIVALQVAATHKTTTNQSRAGGKGRRGKALGCVLMNQIKETLLLFSPRALQHFSFISLHSQLTARQIQTNHAPSNRQR